MADQQLTEASLKEALSNRLDDVVHLDVKDTSSGCGQSFDFVIVSPQFQKLMTLKRHRIVHAALKDELPRIHAHGLVCKTPAEWEKEKEKKEGKGATG